MKVMDKALKIMVNVSKQKSICRLDGEGGMKEVNMKVIYRQF